MFVHTGVNTTVSSGLLGLEYIKPNSTQYINTQFIPTGNTRIIFTFEPTVTDSQALYSGGRTANSGTNTKTFSAFYINKAIRRDYYGTSKTTTTTYDINTKITVDANKNTTLVNGSSALANFTLKTSTTSVMPIILFIAANQSSSTSAIVTSGSGAQYKFYSCKIYDNGTLVRDFIPARRISDWKAGLWDKVNLKFYTDENGEDFEAGAENSIIPDIGTPIEYIQSSGTQYIDSGFKPNQNTRVICKVSNWPLTNKNTTLFGCRTSNSSSDKYMFMCSENPNQYRTDFYNNNQTWAAISSITDTPVIIDKNKNITTIGENSIANTNGTFQSSYNMYIFATNQKGTVSGLSSSTIYYLQIYDGDTLIRDFIPIKTTTNTYGLWDKVNKVFYPNAGTGTFIGGSAVTLTGWHKIKGVWTKINDTTWKKVI